MTTSGSDSSLLERLFSTTPEAMPSALTAAGCWRYFQQLMSAPTFTAGHTSSRALLCGWGSDRLAWAFLGGYQQALRALAPAPPEDPLIAFCVTEESGNTPSAIQTRLDDVTDSTVLNGRKSFVTGAAEAGHLLIAARRAGPSEAKATIVLLGIESSRDGITLSKGRELGMVPEVPHGAAEFNNVRILPTDLLPGDGYLEYVKRFRTIEDTHVQLGVAGYLLSVAQRHGWSPVDVDRLMAIITLYLQLATQHPDDAVTHLQLAGAEQLFQQWLNDTEAAWAGVDIAERERWARDKALLGVATRIRQRRTERARERLGSQAT